MFTVVVVVKSFLAIDIMKMDMYKVKWRRIVDFDS